MKNIFILTLLLTILLGCQCRTESVPDFHADTLRVYATEVFLNDDFYDEVFPIFQNIFHCHVQTTVFQDGFALLDTIRQNDSLDIDIVFGFDNVILNEIRGDSLFIPYEAQNLRFVKKDWQIDPTFQMTPVSHTQIGFIYDSYSIGNAPSTFGEMQDGIFKDKIIIINPNTSSLGRAMLIWSVAAFGENGYSHFWRSVKANIYKITDNYDDAYNMFLAAQAPLVMGYSTTPVYHQVRENTQKYKTTIPSEGSFNYYLTAGIFQRTRNLKLAEKFIEFLLSPDFQEYVPKSMWMYPVNQNIRLDANYELLPYTAEEYSQTLKPFAIKENMAKWIKNWERIMLK